MARTLEPAAGAAGRRFVIAASRFNESVVRNLVDGAVRTFEEAGATVDIAWCPGAVELPLTAQELAATGRYDGVVAMGCVIRGQTPHFDYVCDMAAAGVLEASLSTRVPIAFGVLTCDTLEDAEYRSAPLAGGHDAAEAGKLGQLGPTNKGVEAAESAIDMVNLLQRISQADP
jgi:6,7-dimethyl-8-ribityllumazine synthase